MVKSAGGQAERVPPYNDAMTTLFVSDLHLDPERPAITELFGRFIDEEARGADALYILGDLFEVWVGDDDPSEAGAFVAEKLSALAKTGVPVSFIRGNRDFLLRNGYAARSGMAILPDPAVVVVLAGSLHGSPATEGSAAATCPPGASATEPKVATSARALRRAGCIGRRVVRVC